MLNVALPREAIRRFYDRLGARYDWLAAYEGRATDRAVALLDIRRGDTVLDVGSGTGRYLAQMRAAAGPTGSAIGLDLSAVMAATARRRSHASVWLADARQIPVAHATVDRLFAAYLLDLIPNRELPAVMAEFRRVLRPGGRLALVSLTEGADPASQLVVGLWMAVYRISPLICGGCRPVQLAPAASTTGLTLVAREVVVQAAVPSEIVIAERL